MCWGIEVVGKAVCFIVSLAMASIFQLTQSSRLEILADHQALPSLVFLPSSICSGSSNVTPASVVLLSTSLSTPPPPLVSPLPPFTQLMPRYTGMHACTHLLRIPALPHLWLFPHVKLKKIAFIFFILGSFAQVSFHTQSWGGKVDLSQTALLMNFIQEELLCICWFIFIHIWHFRENEFRPCKFASMHLCQISFFIHISVVWG